jgi:hypothetical protein
MIISPTTASVAKLFIVINTTAIPSLSNIPEMIEHAPRPIEKITSVAPLELKSSVATLFAVSSVAEQTFYAEDIARSTTDMEKVIGELREWAFLKNNWDGEGGNAPSVDSIREAVAFVRLINNNAGMPDPTLLASGRVSLFWHTESLYAEIEFLGNERIAYFIKNNDDKHKGIISFGSEKMSSVFTTLIGI